ncbi:3'-5' exonuclease domain-containing protein 2 [Marinomonas sp. M1K-6]|uniref:3'-5' exonuclease domain-containing protein 2 n=1 Tax=Marinomonas profundi TaxID=2726122 RepID=A0A847R9F3_9GAMM|nr:3'-5' exonuclease [Marinomonas profundi]NLQ16870.1 3'-5' exonuclease domain-containing protein 2 [Marinomonas profundi]UDV02602.1 3'-5' exonuclease domain-containing protein 2 [Marinomonas profundi]
MERPSKEQISELPLYIGLDLCDIHIVENELDAAQAIKILQNETCLGFDTESKPMFQKGQISPGPSLIQLATETKAFLFPIRFAPAVAAAKAILTNPEIKKIGFGIKGDNKELRNKLNIDIVNTQDLSMTLKRLVGEKNSIGARAAVAMILHKRLGKGAQRSNWGAYPLKENQILYAANDAHSALCVEKALVKVF